MNTPPQQLLLDVALKEELTLDNFWVSSTDDGNQQLYELLANLETNSLKKDEFHYINYWGAAGSGKTHLMQGVCQQWQQCGRNTMYLPAAEILDLNPAIFSDLEQLDLIAIDDIDQFADLASWQEGVFHLYNRLQANGRCFLVSSTLPPRKIDFSLADLKSRLTSSINAQLNPLADQDKKLVLQKRAKQRGFDLSDEVISFLMSRSSRDMGSLISVLDKLDVESLRDQRRITIPYLKSILF